MNIGSLIKKKAKLLNKSQQSTTQYIAVHDFRKPQLSWRAVSVEEARRFGGCGSLSRAVHFRGRELDKKRPRAGAGGFTLNS